MKIINMIKIENNDQLKNCPFCGTLHETYMEPTYLSRSPRMGRSNDETNVISVEIRHWCPNIPGQPSQRVIVKVGRDVESVIKLWNMRYE